MSETVERRFDHFFGLLNFSEKDWWRLSGIWHKRREGKTYRWPIYLTADEEGFCDPKGACMWDRGHDDPEYRRLGEM